MSLYSFSNSPGPPPVVAAPARVRCVSHPPLAPLRAWLPIRSAEGTVQDLVDAVAGMLKRSDIELHLQGTSAGGGCQAGGRAGV